MISGGVKNWVELTLHASIADALARLRSDGWRLVVAHADPDSQDFRTVDYTAKVAVVVGAELVGPSPAVLAAADALVAIPMLGLGTSVNVSVAAAVILFEAQRQREAAGLYDTPRLPPAELERALFEWAYPAIARRCRDLEKPYPPLGPDGAILANPFSAARGPAAVS